MNTGGLISKIIENGKATSVQNLPVSNPGSVWDKILEFGGESFEWLLENGLELLKTGFIGVAKFLVENNQIFIVVGVIGMIIVITGKEDFGKKLTSGSVLTYVICRGVAAIC